MAQLIVIIEVLVAQAQAEDPLADPRANRVLDKVSLTRVAKAGRETVDRPDGTVRRSQRRRASARGDLPAIEARHHGVAVDGWKRTHGPV